MTHEPDSTKTSPVRAVPGNFSASGRTLEIYSCRSSKRGFLGFEFRRIRSRRGRWMPVLLPRGKKRTVLLGKLKEILRASLGVSGFLWAVDLGSHSGLIG